MVCAQCVYFFFNFPHMVILYSSRPIWKNSMRPFLRPQHTKMSIGKWCVVSNIILAEYVNNDDLPSKVALAVFCSRLKASL